MNDLDLLANTSKKIKSKEEVKKQTEIKVEEKDDNGEILDLLKKRMEMGVRKYGHGVRVDQNTQDFGTEDDDWELMALEEMLDGLIYTTAQIIRYRRKKNLSEEKKNVNL
jgi:hypothetical protein